MISLIPNSHHVTIASPDHPCKQILFQLSTNVFRGSNVRITSSQGIQLHYLDARRTRTISQASNLTVCNRHANLKFARTESHSRWRIERPSSCGLQSRAAVWRRCGYHCTSWTEHMCQVYGAVWCHSNAPVLSRGSISKQLEAKECAP